MGCEAEEHDVGDSETERRAILEGLEAVAAGQVRDFDEFDREFRERNGIPDEPEADARVAMG